MTRTAKPKSPPAAATAAASPNGLDLAHPSDLPPTALPHPLVDSILAVLIRVHPTPMSLGGPPTPTLLTALSILPRPSLPRTTATALCALWWVDADTCARLASGKWLLGLLVDLESRRVRPLGSLSTSSRGLGAAAARSDLEFVTQWLTIASADLAPLLSKKPTPPLLALTRECAAAHGHMGVLDLAQAKKWPMGGMASISRDLAAASQGGHVAVLKHWNARVIFGHASEAALVGASGAGHVAVLEWWYNHSPTSFKCPPAALVAAARGGHLGVLQWWKDHGFEFSKDGVPEELMDEASKAGREDVLEWINIESGLEFMYSNRALDWAAANGHMGTLEWWADSEMDLPAKHAVDWACIMGRMDVLFWWEKSRWQVKGLQAAFDLASECPYTHWDQALEVGEDGKPVGEHVTLAALQWRVEAELPLKFSARGMRLLCAGGRVDVLRWIKEKWIEFEYDAGAMDAASRGGFVQVLQWWKEESGVDELRYSEAAIEETASTECLEWWGQLGLELRGSLANSEHVGKLAVLQWALAQDPSPASTKALVDRAVRLALPAARFDTLDYCLAHYGAQVKNLLRYNGAFPGLLAAARAGQFGVVQWMAHNGMDLYPPTSILVREVLPEAIRAGCLPIVHWACQMYGGSLCVPREPVDEVVTRDGQLAVVRYCRVFGVEMRELEKCVEDEEEDDDDW